LNSGADIVKEFYECGKMILLQKQQTVLKIHLTFPTKQQATLSTGLWGMISNSIYECVFGRDDKKQTK